MAVADKCLSDFRYELNSETSNKLRLIDAQKTKASDTPDEGDVCLANDFFSSSPAAEFLRNQPTNA